MFSSPSWIGLGPRFSGTYSIDSNLIFKRTDTAQGETDYRQLEAVFDHYAPQIQAVHPGAKIHYRPSSHSPRVEPTDWIRLEIPTEFPDGVIQHQYYETVSRVAQDSPLAQAGNGKKTAQEFAERVIQIFLKGCQLIQGPLPNAPYENRRVTLEPSLLISRRFNDILGNAVDQHYHRTRQVLEAQAPLWNALPESVQVKVDEHLNHGAYSTDVSDTVTMALKDRFGNDITVPLGTLLIFKKSTRNTVTDAQREADATTEASSVDLERFYNTCLEQAQRWIALLKPPGYDSASRKDL